MDFDEKVPIYIQIIDSIKKDLVTEKIKAGEKLNSVREMAEYYKVNPNTIQRVYQELEREGITYTQRGLGTFITDNIAKLEEIKVSLAQELVVSFIDGMKALGVEDEQILHQIENYLKGEDR